MKLCALISPYWNVKQNGQGFKISLMFCINLTILECKVEQISSNVLQAFCINLTILECKVIFRVLVISPTCGINLTILECKVSQA